MFVYQIISEVSINAIIAQKYKDTQYPIYYASKTLMDTETRYPHFEKLALIVTVVKLRLYFQYHPIPVVTIFSLRNILHKHKLTGMLAKWVVELSEYDIITSFSRIYG